MRREAVDQAKRLIFALINGLVDLTEMIAFSPGVASRRLALADDISLIRAVSYFVAAFSVTIVLNKIAYNLLGIDALDEVTYWAGHIGVITAVGSLAFLLGVPVFSSIPLRVYLSSALLAFGACFLLGGVIIAVAAVIIWAAQAAGYIPPILPDLTANDNFAQAAMIAGRECLLNESIVYRAVYNGLGGPFKELNSPFDDLSYMYGGAYFVAPLLFLLLVRATAPQKTLAILTCLLSTGFIYGAIGKYDGAITESSTCPKPGIEKAQHATAVEQVKRFAESFSGKLGQPGKTMTLLAVDAENTTVIFRYRFHKEGTDLPGFHRFVARMRTREIEAFCKSKEGADIQKRGISQVLVIQYYDTEVKETIAIGPDQCIE